MSVLQNVVTAESRELLSVQEQAFTDRRLDGATSSDMANISHVSEAGKSIMQCTEDCCGTATKVKQSEQSRSSVSSHAAAANAGLMSFHSDYTHGETCSNFNSHCML